MTRLASTPPPTPTAHAELAAQFDAFHTARARTGLVARLYSEAMGENYPQEVTASSSCDWPLLGLMAARLQMRPGQLLVDAGCGTGGIGLWLARALAARLEGFDLSPVAIAQAVGRRGHFGLPADHATFRVAALDTTGLPDGCANGAVCVDALAFAPQRGKAMLELARILAPGARLTLTRSLRRNAEPSWDRQARAAGLAVEHVDERPHEPAMWQRLYQLCLDHADDLRRELGTAQAENMLCKARRILPALPGRRAVLLTLRRPATEPATGAVTDTMAGPGRHHGSCPAYGERNPQ